MTEDRQTVEMTPEQAIFFRDFCFRLDAEGVAYYAFVDGYHTPEVSLEWFIKRDLITPLRHPPRTDGISRYFPQSAYGLTKLGETLRDNPQLIRPPGTTDQPEFRGTSD